MWCVSLRNCQVMLTELVLWGGYRAGDLRDCDPPHHGLSNESEGRSGNSEPCLPHC